MLPSARQHERRQACASFERLQATDFQELFLDQPLGGMMADREGFEPPIPLQVCRISSAVHSTTLPPVRGAQVEAGCLLHTRPTPHKPHRAEVYSSFTCLRQARFSLTQAPCPPRQPRPAWGNPRPISFGASVDRSCREPAATAPESNPTTQRLPKSRPACAPSRIHDRAGPNMENNDVRSHQDRRQAIPRRRQ